MIIVTGGAGFIGSNIVRTLNKKGRKDIIVVDNLKEGRRFKNIVDCEILDYLDKDDFLTKIINQDKRFDSIEALFHQGACSTTTEWDGRFMMKNNYEYSKVLLHYCLDRKIPLIYASSAAVYGSSKIFKEDLQYELPLNVYGYSKFLFDQYVRRVTLCKKSQVVGLRYFNVYGPRESHKNSMASVAFHLNNQLKNKGKITLFSGNDNYNDGEQRRDFVYVDDVVAVNLWMLENPQVSGIFNLGTGRSQTFNDVAKSVLDWHGRGSLSYIPFPEQLKGSYQSFTEADITHLRTVGYKLAFKTVEQGVKAYLDDLNAEVKGDGQSFELVV